MPQRDRKGLPSASRAQEWMSCPGSHLLSLSQPPVAEVSAEAARGTLLHAILAGSVPMPSNGDLSEEERHCLLECQSQVESWTVLLGGADQIHREWLHWLHDDGSPVCSGEADVLIISQGKALIVDYKTGRGPVPPADSNPQLLVLSALVADAFPHLDCIYSAILQPLVDSDRRWSAVTSDQFAALRDTVIRSARRAMQPDAPLRAGSWCDYCRAAEVCPELADKAPAAVSTLSIQARPEALAPIPTAEELDRIAQADRLWEAYRSARLAAAKAALAADPAAIPGWTLTPGRKIVTIADPTAAYAALADILTPHQFAGCCKVSLPKLAEACTASGAAPSNAASRRLVETRLASIIETTVSEPALKRAPATLQETKA